MPQTISARDFAITAHGDQRYGARPYAVHLAAVVEIVQTMISADDGILDAVAWLHDVVEDTSVDVSELRERFGETVSVAVDLVSDPPGENRRSRKAALHSRLAAVDPGDAGGRAALLVKAADRLANARASAANSPELLAMYRAEHPEFRSAAFRPGLCDRVWAELDELLAGSS